MNQLRKIIFITTIFCFSLQAKAQVITHEDSLVAGLIASEKSTVISGYGEAKYQNDLRYHTATANVTRAVLFLGHKFSSAISFFSELEVEDAKVAGGESGGEVAFEQLFLKFDLNKDIYLAAGLFVPRLGIINENHLPTTFNGNDRPFVETLIIPATWRELGVCLYGRSTKIAGLNYTLGVVNGLNSAGFEYGSGIREGRWEGRNASASNIAVTGSLLYYFGHFRAQVSGYFGGSAGLSKTEADTLKLANGSFGTPVMLGETDLQYNNKGFSFRAIGTIVQIPDAQKINNAYGKNAPKTMIGGYAEIGYNVLKLFRKDAAKNLTLFGRYEYLDLNNKVAGSSLVNGLLVQNYMIAGLTYQPLKGVIIKADYVLRTTGGPNSTNSIPVSNPFYKTNGFINLGIGYSF